jgi:hypothetical protein
MTGDRDWEPCRFDDDGLLGRPVVHDHFVYAVAAHLGRRSLTLYTQYRDGDGPHPLTDLRFLGVAAHHFDHVADPSILLDVETGAVERVIREWGDLFERGLRNGWPSAECTDLAGLTRQLVEQGVLGYRVMGSCGLDGFVLATGVEYRCRDEEVELP